MLKYFKEGFSLLNKNLKLYFIWAVFMLIYELPTILNLQMQPWSTILTILAAITLILSFIYGFAAYKFFFLRLQNKKVSNKFILQETLKQGRRVILPVIIFGFALFFIIGVVFVVSYSTLGQDFVSANPWITLIAMLPIFLFLGLLGFQGIFFVIEGKGFWTSLKQSISFALKNLKFVGLIFLSFLLLQSIYYLGLPQFISSLIDIFDGYIFLGLSASTILYYQSKEKINPV